MLDEKGKEICFKNVRGYYNTKLLMTLSRLGLFNNINIDEIFDVNIISKTHNILKDHLSCILDYLVITGFFTKTSDSTYILSDIGKDFLPYYGYLFMMVGAYEPVFNNLPNVLNGKLVYGEHIARDGKEVALGMNYIEDFFLDSLRNIISEIEFKKVLDIGCGNANVLTEICKMKSNVTGIGIDINKDVCNEAIKKVNGLGLNNRIKILNTDFFDMAKDDNLFDGLDLVLVMFLMHEILKQRLKNGTVEYLRKISSVLGKNGQLLIIEVSRNTSVQYKENLLFIPEYELVHNFSNQQLATINEWEDILNEAELVIVDTKPIGICQAFGLFAKKG